MPGTRPMYRPCTSTPPPGYPAPPPRHLLPVLRSCSSMATHRPGVSTRLLIFYTSLPDCRPRHRSRYRPRHRSRTRNVTDSLELGPRWRADPGPGTGPVEGPRVPEDLQDQVYLVRQRRSECPVMGRDHALSGLNTVIPCFPGPKAWKLPVSWPENEPNTVTFWKIRKTGEASFLKSVISPKPEKWSCFEASLM